jgi:tetratricopeptide (TPR) repeat protein
MRPPTERPVPTALFVTKGAHPQKAFGELLQPLSPAVPPARPEFPALGTEAEPPARSRVATSPDQMYELGITAAAMSYHTLAIEALRDCIALAPDHALAWRSLAVLLRLAGEDAQADAAESEAGTCDGTRWKKGVDTRTLRALQGAERKLLLPVKDKDETEAAQTLRDHLVSHPLDAVAMRGLARLELRADDPATARTLLERALEVCPAYLGAREDYTQLLLKDHSCESLAQSRLLLSADPDNPRYLFHHAVALIDTGRPDAAIDVFHRLLRKEPSEAQFWLLYASALRTAGRGEESVQAYRKALEIKPDSGQAFWGLAEMKDKVLTEDDVDAMRAHLNDPTLNSESRMAMLYALGQTLERAGKFAQSFDAYEKATREYWNIREKIDKHPESLDSLPGVRRIKAVFSRRNLEQRLVQAPVASDDVPIFVIGMPRAGSTLVEQILSSHSQIEGIGELPLIGDIQGELARSRLLVKRTAYPDCLLEFTPDRLAELGARVIARSREYRKSDRRYFVDKRPWNWLTVGLIHLILPQAKIIDIRREPMAACFAMYKQMLPRDCAWSYDLKEVGRYYNTYVKMMDHWEAVLPGKVHFVRYEKLVQDTEAEIRRMLAYCGLPFEQGCLRFWETERSIVTPSAEQVRRPIFRDAVEQWRNFEPWLGSLKAALAEPVEL